jgi:hypothetical protein
MAAIRSLFLPDFNGPGPNPATAGKQAKWAKKTAIFVKSFHRA